MNRRKFLKQVLMISLLPLLPNIIMAQVRPTLKLELSFIKLGIGFMKATIAIRNLGVAFEEARLSVNTLGNVLLEQEIKRSIEKIATPNDKAKKQLLKMGIEIYETKPA